MFTPIIVDQFSKMLQQLSRFLDKGVQYAESKKFDPEVLLQSRLAPDQFPLIRQVQIACDTAKTAAALCAGKEAPVHEDKEKTVQELKNRIEQVIGYLRTFSDKDFEQAGSRRISRPRWEQKTLSGEEFLLQHGVPNLYFHVTTAYSILRHNGVDLGKKDFLGDLPFRQ